MREFRQVRRDRRTGREVAAGSLEEIIGGRRALLISTDDQAVGFQTLRAGNLAVALEGRRWRIRPEDREVAERLLLAVGLPADTTEVPAALEEAFVALAR